MYGLPCQVMGDTFLRALFLISMHASKRITAATVYSSCIGACEVALDIMKVAGAEPIVPKAFRPVGSSTSPRQRPIRLLMTDDLTAACMGRVMNGAEFLKSTYSRRLVPSCHRRGVGNATWPR